MDTSETYIKMRVTAIPVLGNGTPMLSTFRSENYLVEECDKCAVWIDPKGDWYVFAKDIPKVPHGDMGQEARVCQLERQGQLQEMVGGLEYGFIDWQNWLGNVYGFNYGDYPNGHLHIFKTWEQLWLAHVMKEKYNKVWSGEEWVKSG